MTTQEIKELIGIETYKQLALFAEKQERSINQVVKRLIKQKLPEVDKVDGVTEKDVTFEAKTYLFNDGIHTFKSYTPICKIAN